MKKSKVVIGFLAILSAILVSFFVLRGDNALLFHPKGIIARRELNLMITNYLLMFVIIIPTFILLFAIAWKYRVKDSKAKYTENDSNSVYDPEHSYGVVGQLLLWIIPSVIIAVMIAITWKSTHELDPYRPLASESTPLSVQVVALDWKWLFIYPEQGIATLNFVQFPAGVPVHFSLAADNSPMNSFWIPQLSGQIYAMTGMTTQLHLMADEPGVYTGRAAEINGEGFADMTFIVKSTSPSDFEQWVAEVKQSPLQLTYRIYSELTRPSMNNAMTLYSFVEEGLFHNIVMKYMHECTAK